jgi:hypothetical protein
MTKIGTILVSILAASMLHAVPAAARTVTVNCNDGMTATNALSKLNGWYLRGMRTWLTNTGSVPYRERQGGWWNLGNGEFQRGSWRRNRC